MKTIICTLVFGCSLFITGNMSAQGRRERPEMTNDWIDSLAVAYRNDYLKGEIAKDEKTLADFKERQTGLELKAEEADRFKQEADDAVKASEKAYRAERKAQRLRARAYIQEMQDARINSRNRTKPDGEN